MRIIARAWIAFALTCGVVAADESWPPIAIKETREAAKEQRAELLLLAKIEAREAASTARDAKKGEIDRQMMTPWHLRGSQEEAIPGVQRRERISGEYAFQSEADKRRFTKEASATAKLLKDEMHAALGGHGLLTPFLKGKLSAGQVGRLDEVGIVLQVAGPKSLIVRWLPAENLVRIEGADTDGMVDGAAYTSASGRNGVFQYLGTTSYEAVAGSTSTIPRIRLLSASECENVRADLARNPR